MFIVQDKHTGLYYRNSRSNGKRYGRPEWTSDLAEVLPIRSLNAVRQMFKSTSYIQYEFNRRKWQKDPTLLECCANLGYRKGKTINQCEHYKTAIQAARQKAEAKYRVIEVSLNLGQEQDF